VQQNEAISPEPEVEATPVQEALDLAPTSAETSSAETPQEPAPQPDPVESEPDDSPPPSSDSEEKEPETASEPEPEPEPEPEAEAEPEVKPEADVAPIQYASVQDIDIDSMPEEARRYMEPALEILAKADAEFARERSNYENAREELERVTQQLQVMDGEDRKPLVEALEANQSTISRLSDDIVQTSWDAFNRLHPEAKTLPPEVQQEVAKQFGSIGSRFDEGTTLQQMEDAYAFALYKTKHVQGVVEKQEPIETKRQAVVSDGAHATAPNRIGVDEMDWDELMDKHAHLL